MTDRVVPDSEFGHLGRIVDAFDEADLVAPRLVHLVVVLVLHGIDPIGNRLEVLSDEDAVGLGSGDHGGLVLEDRRVVLGHLLHRVGREEPDETLGHRVGLVAVGRIARNDHRVDLVARREDVTHRIERIALVVVAHGASEIERIGRIGEQRVPHLDEQPLAADREPGLLLHLRRGEELLLLVLELDVFVEFNIDLLSVRNRRITGREVVGRHGHDHRRERVDRSARGGHHRGATAQKSRSEEQQHAAAQKMESHASLAVHRRVRWGRPASAGSGVSGSE